MCSDLIGIHGASLADWASRPSRAEWSSISYPRSLKHPNHKPFQKKPNGFSEWKIEERIEGRILRNSFFRVSIFIPMRVFQIVPNAVGTWQTPRSLSRASVLTLLVYFSLLLVIRYYKSIRCPLRLQACKNRCLFWIKA